MLKANGTPLAIDDATRLKAGDYILTLDADLGDSNAWAGATAPTTQRATVHVTAKQTTLFNLAALKLGLDVPSPDEGDIKARPSQICASST